MQIILKQHFIWFVDLVYMYGKERTLHPSLQGIAFGLMLIYATIEV